MGLQRGGRAGSGGGGCAAVRVLWNANWDSTWVYKTVGKSNVGKSNMRKSNVGKSNVRNRTVGKRTVRKRTVFN